MWYSPALVNHNGGGLSLADDGDRMSFGRAEEKAGEIGDRLGEVEWPEQGGKCLR
jgi:hypothetical protein